ncbi:MAG: hypothetical protein WA948_05665 [Pontixanthobacter sp.]
MKRSICALAAVGLILPQLSYAQTSGEGRPDEGDSWKYFYFHKSDISVEQARTDIIQCYGYAENLTVMESGPAPTYTSVPYGGSNGLSPAAAALVGGIGGLAGSIITGFMNAGKRREMARTNLRKCFGFKEYSRYELAKEDYETLHDGEDDSVRARLVAKATGPAPQSERLVP